MLLFKIWKKPIPLMYENDKEKVEETLYWETSYYLYATPGQKL